jgi:hypothetical protein
MHKYIQALEYAFKNESFTEPEATEALKLNAGEFGRYIRSGIAEPALGPVPLHADQKWVMTSAALMNYLEYIELKEARESSAQAKYISIWAIGISAFLAISSISISLYQLTTIPKININNVDKFSVSNEFDEIRSDLKTSNRALQKISKQSEALVDEVKATNKTLNSTPKSGAN